jgi:HAD superfamily hydrolase (TIGR01509 family)
MNTLRHILFDNDGTIVDSEILAVRTMLRLLEQTAGFRMSEREYSQRYPGLLERDIVAILEKEHGVTVPDDFFRMLHADHVVEFRHSLRAIPGMPTLFRQLKIPKSMVSNGSVRHVDFCLRKVKLRGALNGHIFSAEHVQSPKPAPDVYQFALQTIGLASSQVLVIEDSPTGVRAAKSAGIQVVGFLGAAHIHDGHDQNLLDAGADYLAADASALAQLLKGMGAL